MERQTVSRALQAMAAEVTEEQTTLITAEQEEIETPNGSYTVTELLQTPVEGESSDVKLLHFIVAILLSHQGQCQLGMGENSPSE